MYFSVVKQWIARKKRGKSGDEIKPRWEQDYELIPNEGLFGEYLEMGKPCVVISNKSTS